MRRVNALRHSSRCIKSASQSCRGALLAMSAEDIQRRALLAHVFPQNKYPEANRAYRVLVSSDRRSRYWISLSDHELLE